MKESLRRKAFYGLAAASLLVASLACSSQSSAPTATAALSGPTRSFHLGFTPFPYDISAEAVKDVYAHIASDGDIIAHHFDNGVPWPEALAGEPYSENIRNDWAFRKANTPPGHKVYVAITPINLWRDGLAPYRGVQDDMALPAPWDSYAFDHPEVIEAYLNYAISVVDYFEPDYLAIGIESNLLINSHPELWDGYLHLHRTVYTQLKARYPDLPIFVSVAGVDLLDGYREEDDHAAQLAALADLEEYSDLFGISLYPYLSQYLAEERPDDFWDELLGLSDKPVAITETGFPAEAFSVLDGSVRVEGSPEKQATYVAELLDQAEQHHFVFIIYFISRDYDALYEKLDADMRELGLLWRDTGLYAGNGSERPALALWKTAVQRTYTAP